MRPSLGPFRPVVGSVGLNISKEPNLFNKGKDRRQVIKQPEKTADVFMMPTLVFLPPMTSEKQKQKFHIDDTSLPRPGQVLLIGWGKFPTWHDESEALTQVWVIITMEFVCSFLRYHFKEKPVVALENVGRIYLFIYQLFWTQAYPEVMCTNGTQVPWEVPSLRTPTTRRGLPHNWGLQPLLFLNSNGGSFTSHKN